MQRSGKARQRKICTKDTKVGTKEQISADSQRCVLESEQNKLCNQILENDSSSMQCNQRLQSRTGVDRLSVASEGESVSSLPGSSPGATNALVGEVTSLEHTTVVATSGGETTELTVLVSGVADPVDLGIVSDGIVRRIDKNDLVVLVGGILRTRRHAEGHTWLIQ